MKLQRSSASGAGPPDAYGTCSGREVDVLILGPTAVRGITQIVSAVDIGGRLGFKARHIAVTRCLDLLRQRAYSVSRAATPEYGRRPVRRSGPSPEKGGAPQRGQRIDKGAAACCYLERAAGRGVVISDKSLRTVRVCKRRGDYS